MDAVIEPTTPSRRKRESGYGRMKRRALIAESQRKHANDLEKEVVALEALADRLLNHLEAAVSADLTEQQRRGYLNLIFDVRKNLSGEG